MIRLPKLALAASALLAIGAAQLATTAAFAASKRKGISRPAPTSFTRCARHFKYHPRHGGYECSSALVLKVCRERMFPTPLQVRSAGVFTRMSYTCNPHPTWSSAYSKTRYCNHWFSNPRRRRARSYVCRGVLQRVCLPNMVAAPATTKESGNGYVVIRYRCIQKPG